MDGEIVRNSALFSRQRGLSIGCRVQVGTTKDPQVLGEITSIDGNKVSVLEDESKNTKVHALSKVTLFEDKPVAKGKVVVSLDTRSEAIEWQVCSNTHNEAQVMNLFRAALYQAHVSAGPDKTAVRKHKDGEKQVWSMEKAAKRNTVCILPFTF